MDVALLPVLKPRRQACQQHVFPLSRYPKIMTDEGIRVVRQWLGATDPPEEGEFAGPNPPSAPRLWAPLLFRDHSKHPQS